MVKGLSRKVIIVKSPDPKIFEQAIFIVRDDFFSSQGIGEKELLRQAKQAANGYVNQTYGWHRFHSFYPMVFGVVGAAAVALLWICTGILF
ncbi:MAG: translation initiation factor 2 [Oscillospiraceae bacterium]|nr:translation initiation factor 2 [Oscillospiraceae bacterium]